MLHLVVEHVLLQLIVLMLKKVEKLEEIVHGQTVHVKHLSQLQVLLLLPKNPLLSLKDYQFYL